MPSTNRSQQRAPGLDTLRAFAILIVMLYHFNIQRLVPGTLVPVARVGWIGVDLFFALSGFLIGGQLLRPYAAGDAPRLLEFYLRRSLRILPAFLVVMVLYLFVPAWREAPGPYAPWQYFTFTWNLLLLHYPQSRAFSHIWSLCVEEHFYLLLPPLLLLLRPPVRRVTAILLLLGTLCAGIALRAWLLHHLVLSPSVEADEQGLQVMRSLYYPTYTRLDGLAVGVGLAAMRVFWSGGWARAARHGHITFLTGCAFVAGALWACEWQAIDADLPASILFAFPLLAIGFGLLLLAAVSERGWLRLRVPGASWIATVAFSLYLTHKSVAHMVHAFLAERHVEQAWLLLAASCLASIAAAAVLYYAVERPCLMLRDRWLGLRGKVIA